MKGISRKQLEFKRFKREERYVTYIYAALIGIIVSTPLFEKFIPSTILRLFDLSCVAVILYSLFALGKRKMLVGYRGWNKVLILLLGISCIQIICRNDWSECKSVKDLLLLGLSYISTLPYLLPFATIFLPNERHTNRICNIFFYASMLTLPLWLLNYSELVQDSFHGESVGAWLPFFACFALVFPNNLSRSKKLAMWGVWAVYLLLMLLNARRQMCFTLVFYALIWFYELISKRVRNRVARFFIYTILLFFAGANILMGVGADKFSEGPFTRLAGRIDEDTRSQVELLFWADYLSSKPEEQAFGKGGTGTYYQEMIINERTGEKITERPVVETGYLMMLLKGGYVHLAIIVLLILTALVKSFRSKYPDSSSLFWLFILFIICNYSSSFVCLYYSHSIVFWLCISLALHERNSKNTKRKIAKNSVYYKSH